MRVDVTVPRAVVLGTFRAGRGSWAFGRRAQATIVGVASPRSRAVSAGEKPQAARSHGLSATAPLSRRPAGSLGPPPAASSGASIGRRRPRPPAWIVAMPTSPNLEMLAATTTSARDCDNSPTPCCFTSVRSMILWFRARGRCLRRLEAPVRRQRDVAMPAHPFRDWHRSLAGGGPRATRAMAMRGVHGVWCRNQPARAMHARARHQRPDQHASRYGGRLTLGRRIHMPRHAHANA